MHYTYNKKTRNKNLLNKAFFNLHWLIHSFFCSLACSHANAAEILVEAISKRIWMERLEGSPRSRRSVHVD